MDISKISVCILVKNAQSTLQECLQSLCEFGEIVLLDNESTDDTLKIAQEFNATYKNLRIEKSEFIGFGALKNLAVSFAKNEWILSIDSDEVLENEALNEIKALNLSKNCIVALPRKNLYANEWIRACGWHPDFVWRIFNKNFTKFNDNKVHESVILPTNSQKIQLKGALRHYAFNDIAQLIDKMQRYSGLWAKQNAHKGSSPLKACVRGMWSFVRSYFFKKGVFYGYKGFIISVCNALGVFFKYMKLCEARRPSCSLIITTYNQPARLALVLDSVRRLSLSPNEVLVADDGSTDETKELVNAFQTDFPCPLRHIWHEDKGFRLAQIRNKAIKSAQNEYIIIIDGDMILHKDFIKGHLNFAKKGVFLQGSRVILNQTYSENLLKNYENSRKNGENLKTQRIKFFSLKALNIGFLARLIYKGSLLDSAVFEKCELIRGVRGCNMSFFKDECEAVNGFNEAFEGWGREDSEFVARFLFKGGMFRRLKFAGIAYHIWHSENSRKDFAKNHELYLSVIKNKSKWAEFGLKKG